MRTVEAGAAGWQSNARRLLGYERSVLPNHPLRHIRRKHRTPRPRSRWRRRSSNDIIPGTTKISHQIVTVDFSQKASTLRYVNIQKTRKIRVAFSSLSEYAKKENRNGYTYTNAKIEALKKQAFIILSNINSNMKKLNASLIAALSDEERIDAEIEAFLSSVDYTALKRTQEFIDVKELLKQIMELVAQELSSNWDDPRYSRETADE